MRDLTAELRRALAKIPHRSDCYCSESPENPQDGPCICYPWREEVMAHAVRRAIESAMRTAIEEWHPDPLMITVQSLEQTRAPAFRAAIEALLDTSENQ